MILSIDLGSTTFKVGIYDHALAIQGTGSGALSYDYGTNGEVDLPVDRAMEAFRSALQQVDDASGGALDQIEAIAITSQAQTFTVLDEGGTPLIPFVSWMDTRAKEAGKAARAADELCDFSSHCSFGSAIDQLQICQLRRLRDAGFIANTHRIVNLPTTIIAAMSSEMVVSDNLAAMSGLYSLQHQDWWADALAFTGLKAEQLPRLAPVGTVAAKTNEAAADFGVPSGIPIVLAGNDQTAGGFGANLHEQDAALITLGTAQVIYACRETMPPPHPELVRGPFPGGKAYQLAADSVGGSTVTWAKGIISGAESDEAYFKLAAQAPSGCDGLTFSCDLDQGGGSWTRLSYQHKPAHLARAVVEGLSKRLAKLMDAMGLDLTTTPVLAAGGGSQSPVWLSILGDALSCELTRTEADPLRGAAAMAIEAVS